MRQDHTDIFRDNLRRIIDHDPEYNATTLSTEFLGKGKDFINDFLNVKDGVSKKKGLGGQALFMILARYGFPAETVTTRRISNLEIIQQMRMLTAPVDDLGRKFADRKFSVRTFDPDDHEEDVDLNSSPSDEAGVGESNLRIVGQTDDSPSVRPHDAIFELVSVGGLGSGQEIETEWVKDGDGHKQVDAMRDDYWRFPKAFLSRDLKRSPKQLMVVECEGDSMEPTITSGARVVVDVQHTSPSPDGIYAIRDRFGAIRIKRLQVSLSGEPRVRVLCDNRSHPVEEIPLRDLVVIGRVLGAIRTF